MTVNVTQPVKKLNAAVKTSLPLIALLGVGGGSAFASSRNQSSTVNGRLLKSNVVVYPATGSSLVDKNIGLLEQNTASLSPSEESLDTKSTKAKTTNTQSTTTDQQTIKPRLAFAAFSHHNTNKTKQAEVVVDGNALAFLKQNDLLSSEKVTKASISGNTLGRKNFAHTLPASNFYSICPSGAGTRFFWNFPTLSCVTSGGASSSWFSLAACQVQHDICNTHPNVAPEFDDADDTIAMTLDEDAAGTIITDGGSGIGVIDTNVGDTLTWVQGGTAPTKGSVNITGTALATGNVGDVPGTYTYLPTANANGADNFTVDVSDGNGGTDTLTVNVTINSIADIIADTVPVDATYASTTNLDFTATFDESVTVAGLPRIALDIGGVTKYASYLSGSPGTALTFRYVVEAGLNDNDGIGATSVVDLNGGTIIDSDGDGSGADLSAISFATTTGVLVDSVAPTVAAVSIADSVYKVGDTVTATITVTSDTDDYSTGSGGISGTINGYTLGSLSKTNDTTYTATFTVTDGGTDIAAGSNIAVNFTLDDSLGNTSAAFTTAINQANDAMYANLPDIDLTADTNTIAEDGGVATLTGTLSGSLNNQWPEGITVNLAYTGTATSGTDYNKSDSFVISAGNSSNSVAVTGIADSLFDSVTGSEGAIVDISSLSLGHEGSINQQTVTITDAEVAPTVILSVSNASIAENGGTSSITATLTHATYDNVTVNLIYSGTAIGGNVDYNTPNTAITITGGATSANAVTGITAVDDVSSEGNLIIIVNVSSVIGGSASESGSQQKVVTIIDDENIAPTAHNKTVNISENSNKSFVITAFDANSDAMSYTLLTQPSRGALSGSAPNLTYTPNINFDGIDSFTFKVNDGSVDSNTATVSLVVSNRNNAPIAKNQTVNTQEDTPAAIVLNASDADGESLNYTVVSQPAKGVLTGSAPNLHYQPNDGVYGVDSFSFRVNDGIDNSNLASITINITEVNSAPIADEQSIKIKEDSSQVIVLTANDADDDELTYSLLTQTEHGKLIGIPPLVTYIPNDNFNGSDNFIFKVNDTRVDSAEVMINIEVSEVNDAPVAADDSLVRELWDTVEIDVLANDSDIENDPLVIIGATADIGMLTFTEKLISYKPNRGFTGQATIEYHIEDILGARSSALVFIDFNVSDKDLPIITLPADIEINAQALFTKVELGTATAVDRVGNSIPLSIIGSPLLQSGISHITWQAVDSDGRIASASQQVTIHPLISINKDQIALEGYDVKVEVDLSGAAPNYPLSIPYTVAGTAEHSVDHDLIDGEIIINSGMSGSLSFNVFNDDVIDDGEKIEISLSGDLNLGSKSRQVITITENKVIPKIILQAEQNGDSRFTLNTEDGLVKVLATVNHPNLNKLFSYQWQSTDSALIDIDDIDQSFLFTPEYLTAGLYHLSLLVTDLDDSENYARESVALHIVQASTKLTDKDSDNDGIADNLEGLADDNSNGIANYLDNIKKCNILPARVDFTDSFLIEGEPGICLRLGDRALSESSLGGTAAGALLNSVAMVDTEATNIGGIFDFIAYGLPVAGQSYKVVLPQLQPVSHNAVYRKQQLNGEWGSFILSNTDRIWSIEGEPGYCPPPNDSSWQEGLGEGHWCVQLQISDGGPNDADGDVNGRIEDPGGVAVLINDNTQPEAEDDESETRINTATSIDVLNNDTDVDGDHLFITSVNALFGTVSIVDNQLYFEPKEDIIGVDSLVYGVSDGKDGVSSATVSVMVKVNEVPLAEDDIATSISGNTISIAVLSNDSDIENDELTVILAVAENGIVTINQDNTINYASNQNFEGIDTISYQIQDALGAQASAQVSVTVVMFTPEPVQRRKSSGSMYWLLLSLIGFIYLRKGVRK